MSFIYGLHLKYFRIFEGENNFEFSPLTILTGSNSCGKSTINTALNLINLIFKNKIVNSINDPWKGEIKIDELFKEINLQDLEKEFSDFSSLLNYQSKENYIEIGFPILLEFYPITTKMICRFQATDKIFPTGQLTSLEIREDLSNISIFSIFTKVTNSEKIDIFYQINYRRFYDIYIQEFKEFKNITEKLLAWKKENRYSMEIKPDAKNEVKNILKENYGNYNYSITLDDNKIFINEDDIDRTSGNDYFFYETKERIKKISKKSFFVLNNNASDNQIIDDNKLSRTDLNEIKKCTSDRNITINDLFIEANSNKEHIVGNISENGDILSYVNNNLFDSPIIAFDEFLKANNINVNFIEGKEHLFKNKYKEVYSESGKLFIEKFVVEQLLNSLRTVSTFPLIHINNKNSININRDIDIKNYKQIDQFLKFNEINPVLLNFINYWIKKFAIGDGVKIKRLENKIFIYVKQGKKLINVSDLGFGVSRILPLIVNISMIAHNVDIFPGLKDGRILLIEEPELGLHPKNQSLLADFFIDLKRILNIQIIVETHSEYFIRKLQVLMANEKIKYDDIQIYYFHHIDNIPKGESQVSKINIYQDGSLSRNFGKGFFDESSNLNIALYRFSRERHN